VNTAAVAAAGWTSRQVAKAFVQGGAGVESRLAAGRLRPWQTANFQVVAAADAARAPLWPHGPGPEAMGLFASGV